MNDYTRFFIAIACDIRSDQVELVAQGTEHVVSTVEAADGESPSAEAVILAGVVGGLCEGVHKLIPMPGTPDLRQGVPVQLPFTDPYCKELTIQVDTKPVPRIDVQEALRALFSGAGPELELLSDQATLVTLRAYADGTKAEASKEPEQAEVDASCWNAVKGWLPEAVRIDVEAVARARWHGGTPEDVANPFVQP